MRVKILLLLLIAVFFIPMAHADPVEDFFDKLFEFTGLAVGELFLEDDDEDEDDENDEEDDDNDGEDDDNGDDDSDDVDDNDDDSDEDDQDDDDTDEDDKSDEPQCTPSPEICDNIDNDCDNQIDEDITKQCGLTDIGVCSFGIETCAEGNWGKCEGSIDPDIETCDNLDNDCDGAVDEELIISCGTNIGICTEGTQTCSLGNWSMCSGTQSQTEACDGVDNNCDGEIDEGCSCIHNEQRACGSDEGQCQAGTQTCFFGSWQECENQITAIDEICDGIDNDCDGEIDENLIQECGNFSLGICKTGQQQCVAGQWSVCEGEILPDLEICDNLDNDCDGNIDESISRSCGFSTQGTCILGTETCGNGLWSTCDAIYPIDEICEDNLDNNCNGAIDEFCPMEYNQTEYNMTDYNETEIIEEINETWYNETEYNETPTCIPEQEICDGIDNDCDFLIDEELTQSCGSNIGACAEGTSTCSNGEWGACIGEILPTAETCNNIDDNCNNQIDENITQSCGADVGVCQSGTQICTQGQWNLCTNAITPINETCDGLDNNCDGLIDNGITCTCTTGDTRQCGTDIGVCEFGTQTCQNNAWGPCINATEPTSELCDNLDNNCDGTIDEINQQCGTTDIGACQYGTQSCTVGNWSICNNNIEPGNETCDNNIDDNCNGKTDEGCVKEAPPISRSSGGGSSSKRITTAVIKETAPITPLLKAPKITTPPEKRALTITVVNQPNAIDINDQKFSVEAIVENTGTQPLQNIEIEPEVSPGWNAKKLSLTALQPQEKQPITIDINSELCTNKETEFKEQDVSLSLTAESGKTIGYDKVHIPINIQGFSIITPTPKPKSKEMKVCFVLNNKAQVPKEKLEIEFEVYDQKQDAIIDFISPVKIPKNTTIIKPKTYKLGPGIEQKVYNVRSHLFENGSVFSEGYIVGKAHSTIELSETEPKQPPAFIQWLKKLFNR